jgi:hypothetical protein
MATEEMTWGRRCSDMTSYEHFDMANKASKRASNASITGLAIGVGAAVVGIGAWIFSGVNSKALAKGNQREIDLLARGYMQDRDHQHSYNLANNPSLKAYIDVATGGASAGANANASAASQLEAALLASRMGGGQVCPTPVALYQPAMPCSCNTCGN